MSTSTRKIVAGLLTFAMVLTLVVGLSTAPASAASFTRSLTVGSTGADVVELQTILVNGGYLVMPAGVPMGYFGSLTKRAVATWQAAMGISPAVGYFGPISRAALAGTPSVPTTGGVAGCPAGAVYNYMTGERCSTSTPTTSTTEGTLTVTQSASPANNSNIQTNSDVSVYGLELKAKLADVTVSRLDLDVSVTVSASGENPGNFINTIKLWDGSTLLKSWAVGTADFVTGSTAGQYYVRLSNIGYVVPKDTTKNLIVSFSTNGGIDSDRTVVVKGYGTNSLLTVSGSNISSYYDVSGSSFTRTHVFKKPGTSNLTVAADSSNPLSQTVRVNTTSGGAQNVTLLNFSVKSDTGDSKITSVATRATSTDAGFDALTALYLYDGSTLVGSQSFSTTATNATITFNNLSLMVPKDTTKTLTITGDFSTVTANASIASTSVTSVTYEKPNGSSATVSTAVNGNDHYFYSVSPQWTLLSATAVSNGTDTSGTTTGLTATFVLKVKPVGGSMVVPVVGDFGIDVASSTSANATTSADSISVAGNPTILAEGSEYTITLTKNKGLSSFTGLSASTLTSEWFNLKNASSSINGVSVNQTWGLSNFKTNPVTFTK